MSDIAITPGTEVILNHRAYRIQEGVVTGYTDHEDIFQVRFGDDRMSYEVHKAYLVVIR